MINSKNNFILSLSFLKGKKSAMYKRFYIYKIQKLQKLKMAD